MDQASKMKHLCQQLALKLSEPLLGPVLGSFIQVLLEEQQGVDEKVDKLLASHYKTAAKYLEDGRKLQDHPDCQTETLDHA